MTDFSEAKAALEARRQELAARLQRIEGELDTPHDANWDEDAVVHEGDEVLEGLGQKGEAELRAVDAALARIADGSYGDCARCGNPIPAARLRVLPATAVCAACAAR
jgi:RNA polymerase-binding transcription factor DksA